MIEGTTQAARTIVFAIGIFSVALMRVDAAALRTPSAPQSIWQHLQARPSTALLYRGQHQAAQAPPPIKPEDCEKLKGHVKASSCEVYSFDAGIVAGCVCFVDGAGCPASPGPPFTGKVVAEAPLNLPEMGGVIHTTCFYRQWLEDPTVFGAEMSQQISDKSLHYMMTVYTRSLQNAKNNAALMWAAVQTTTLPPPPTTPGPWWWLTTTPAPLTTSTAFAPGPVPGPGPAPGPAFGGYVPAPAPTGPVAAPAR